jgi:hypothetical protein
VNRAARRAAGITHRPHTDVVLTVLPGAVLVGLKGAAGHARFTPSQARELAAELAELADSAQGALS